MFSNYFKAKGVCLLRNASTFLNRTKTNRMNIRSFGTESNPKPPPSPPKGFEKFFEGGSKIPPHQQPRYPRKLDLSPWQHGVVVGVLLYAGYSIVKSLPREEEITFHSFLGDLFYKGRVDRLQIVNKSHARVFVRADAPPPFTGRVFRIQLGSAEQFEAKLDAIQSQMGLDPVNFVPVQYKDERDWGEDILRFLPTLLLLIPLVWSMKALSSGLREFGGMKGGGNSGKDGGGIFSFRKAFPVVAKDLKQKVKFSDVAGLAQAKMEILEFVDFLKHPAKFNFLGARIPKGALLVGPPGTGKTLLAKAVAGEAGVPFYSMSGSDFIEMFVGVGPSRVRDLFAQARKSSPSIIFIDEIDAVGRKRSKGGFGGGGNDERENTLNQLLVEMDGFSTSTGVVVLAGTNRADILDPALTRPGRFDRNIPIDRPDLEEREEIFCVHLKNIKLNKAVLKDDVAKRMSALTPGMVGADIANICNEAAIFAARRDAGDVELTDFERACERIIGGMAKSKNLMTETEKRTVSIHESGHAVAGWFLQHADPLLKVSIIPRSSGALGFAQYLPEELSLHSKEALLDKICVILAGRAAEEVFVGKITTGAADDFEKVTSIAYGMVQMYGMNSDIGTLSWNSENMKQYAFKPFSEATAQKIDLAVRKLVDGQYKRSKELLLAHSDELRALSEKLFVQETIVYQDIKQILGERPWPIKSTYAKYVDQEKEQENEIPNEVEEPDPLTS